MMAPTRPGFEGGAAAMPWQIGRGVPVSLCDVMRRYCDGDERAFDELYGALAPRILAYLRSIVRGASAEDLLQLTFMKLHMARGSYVLGADPVPWVYTIALRTALDDLRKTRSARLSVGREEVPELHAGHDGVAVGAEQDEPYAEGLRRAVLAAVEQLPHAQRQAVVLTKLDGRPVREVAEMLGTSETAVKLRAHRAYARLRELLQRDAALA